MRYEKWTPAKGEAWKPWKVTEPTLWEMTFTDPALTDGSQDYLNMARLFSSAMGDEVHHFRAVFTNGIVPDAMLAGLSEMPNIRLAVGPIHTQECTNVRMYGLLATKAVAKELIFEPFESIRLDRISRPTACQHCGSKSPYATLGRCGPLRGLPAHAPGIETLVDRIIVRGGDVPLSIEHVRFLRDQAIEHGSKFSLTWGVRPIHQLDDKEWGEDE